MGLLRIASVTPLGRFKLRLGLTDGSNVERDLESLLTGQVFEELRNDQALFRSVRVESGTIAWPNGADLCPDTVIWGGAPPSDPSARAPRTLTVPPMLGPRVKSQVP